MPVGGQYALSGYIGGFTSHVMGGDFLKGAISAIIVHGFNDLLHPNIEQYFVATEEEAYNLAYDLSYQKLRKEVLYAYLVDYDISLYDKDGKPFFAAINIYRDGKWSQAYTNLLGHTHIVKYSKNTIGISGKDILSYDLLTPYGVQIEIMYQRTVYIMNGSSINAYVPKTTF